MKYVVTVFKDQNTPDPFIDKLPTSDSVRLKNTLPDHICLDCMGFGMGMCCLQVWSYNSRKQFDISIYVHFILHSLEVELAHIHIDLLLLIFIEWL